ncbi:MAG: hypothetical protein U0Q07_08470 [Acidimicrobiales bacterium]
MIGEHDHDGDRAAEAVDHLQTAALEMIAAARAFLDVVEDVVADREKVAEVVATVGTVADAAARAATRGAATRGAATAPSPHHDAPADAGIQHIEVS